MNKIRKQLDLSGSVTDAMLTMAEGNVGALTVLQKLIKADALFAALHLDDMNMRGPQIWVAYKDHCDGDLEVFINHIKARDDAMIETVNKNSGISEVAVKRNASMRTGK